MKIGLTICEYNPFHNGHAYSLDQIRASLNPDALAVIMSGNFTERGETAVMHKYQRAKHAILAGADIVFELPTVFATAPAEIFAKGAVKLLGTLKGEKTLCFGIESGTKSGLIATATALSSESKEFKALLKKYLSEGFSPVKAKHLALEELNPPGIDLGFTASPNNILALEYAKAIVEGGFQMDLLPILRKGAGYKDTQIDEKSGNLSSAAAIRTLILNGERKKTKKYLPPFVYGDLPDELPSASELALYSLITTPKKQLTRVLDCTEGLENRIKAMLKDCFTREELIKWLTTRRYTSARLSRIAINSMLTIYGDFVKKCLKSDLYLKVLAIRADRLDLLSSLQGETPFVVRKKDADALCKTALECFQKDALANDIYNLITKEKTNEYETKIISV